MKKKGASHSQEPSSSGGKHMPGLGTDMRIALLYVLFGGFWILFSDRLLAALVTDPAVITRVQTYKGWAFIAASALIIFLLLRRELRLRTASEGKFGEIEERYHQLFENAVEGIFQSSLEGRYLIVNPAMARIYRYDSPADMTASVSDIRNQIYADPDQRAQFTKQLAETGYVERFEAVNLRKDGGRFWSSINARVVRDPGGNEIYYEGFIEDITERKQAEEELRLSRERLSKLSRQLAEAREAEARAIGRELHDQFGQMLTAMKITLDLAAQLPAEAAAKKLAQAQELAGDLLSRVSRLSLELRPPMLDDLGLLPALEWHVKHYREQAGVMVEFNHSGLQVKRFGTEIETTAYRILQEALTNVVRHAQARQVRLEVNARKGWLEIRIEDDGVGFDPESALAENRGLSGMRERASLVGGTFEVESEKGGGSRELIRLPIQERAA